jgi:hypothetical protein
LFTAGDGVDTLGGDGVDGGGVDTLGAAAGGGGVDTAAGDGAATTGTTYDLKAGILFSSSTCIKIG